MWAWQVPQNHLVLEWYRYWQVLTYKLFPDFELILTFYLVFYMFLTLQFDPWDNACAKALFLRLIVLWAAPGRLIPKEAVFKLKLALVIIQLWKKQFVQVPVRCTINRVSLKNSSGGETLHRDEILIHVGCTSAWIKTVNLPIFFLQFWWTNYVRSLIQKPSTSFPNANRTRVDRCSAIWQITHPSQPFRLRRLTHNPPWGLSGVLCILNQPIKFILQ